MKVQSEDGNSVGVALLLGGSPDEMDKLAEGEGFFRIDFSLQPYALAQKLAEAANWIRRMQIRFPDGRVDCWVEAQLGIKS